MRLQLLPLFLLFIHPLFGQSGFPTDPTQAQLVTSDIPLFWQAFDQLEGKGNPFDSYLEQGSQGVKDFIPYRIESPRNLKKTVQKRKEDYLKIREKSLTIETHLSPIEGYYLRLDSIYPDAVFPPAYFVIGAFNSGGTSSKNGIIMGVETQQDMSYLPIIVVHELIHFNQVDITKNTLLAQSIKEGAADFLTELVTGIRMNQPAADYGMAHEKVLCEEFVQIMNDQKYHGWLYGSAGKDNDRPNDLGYWMGYQICKAYYDQAEDKSQAIINILDLNKHQMILEKGGYLAGYL
ncbi:DUF2268 domain-containing protein [Reichenbachiella ulvae]|uniref:DUF2268 domain-containing protein n=1 Tax=Reichenbachiella ulvae TaxID=2980104 RepID=A0ABT3CZT5_9BACT|nr:DUF2268 domain-containing protein [Reichenbachiella ulvae]MCV9389086.1 DUF2268 domain-containing protein [Reichenbachiella ulvae]